jgi:Right handed beta helix region
VRPDPESVSVAQTEDRDLPTIRVNCNAGQTIEQALQRARPGTTILVSGTCRERVTITTDRITLDGRGSAILDGRSNNPGTAGVQSDPEFDGVVIIDGVTGVTLTGLTIQNGLGNGIFGRRSAAFAVRNTAVQDNSVTGIVVSDNSTVELADSTIQRNSSVGIDVFNNSSVILKGAISITNKHELGGVNVFGSSTMEIRGARVQLNNNRGVGLVVGSGSQLAIFGFNVSQGSTLTANANGAGGIVLAGGSLEVFGFGAPTGPNIITATNNGEGIFVAGGFIVSPFGAGKFIVENNPVGLNFGQAGGAVIVGGLTVRNNKTGVLADGAGPLTFVSIPPNPSIITGNGTDVDLRFGTRTTIDGVAIGTITCDKTVLSRGTTMCP